MRIAVPLIASFAVIFGAFACKGSDSSAEKSTNDGGVAVVGDAGTSDAVATNSEGGTSTTEGAALPLSSFLFVRRVAANTDHLIAFDAVTQQARVVTDLHGDGGQGWSIDGYAISPDRKRVVLSSLYGPTKADIDTGLSTQRIYTLDMDGGDFQRLTPVFPNNSGGQSGFRIDVRDPAFSLDGANVIYDYGEGTSTSGFSRPWFVSTAGNGVPAPFPVRNDNCSIIDNVSTNPKTGETVVSHSVCIQSADQGIYLYPAAGGDAPVKLFTPTGMSLVSSPPRWSADGSAFLFTGIDFATNARSLYAFSMTTKQASVIVPGSATTSIMNGSLSPDGNILVYCTRTGDVQDLHVIDLSVDPPTDAPLTNDGASCDPQF